MIAAAKMLSSEIIKKCKQFLVLNVIDNLHPLLVFKLNTKQGKTFLLICLNLQCSKMKDSLFGIIWCCNLSFALSYVVAWSFITCLLLLFV